MATSLALTIEDFETLPQELVKNHELIDGELVPMSGNTGKHNAIRDFLIYVMWPLVHQNGSGMVISEQEFEFGANAHAPDVAYFSAEKRSLYDDEKRVQRFVPDFAIEIVSLNDDGYSKLLKKKARYIEFGVSEVWIIAPEGPEVHVYTAGQNKILTRSDELSTPLIPGFRLTVKELFDSI